MVCSDPPPPDPEPEPSLCSPWPECSDWSKIVDVDPGVKFHFHTLGNEPDMDMAWRSLVEGDEWIDYTPV